VRSFRAISFLQAILRARYISKAVSLQFSTGPRIWRFEMPEPYKQEKSVSTSYPAESSDYPILFMHPV